MILWDFALAAWERPGVGEACLELQDLHGQCVALLLWRTWAAAEGRPVEGATIGCAVALARTWECEVIAPLRTVRRVLSRRLDGLANDAREPIRGAVRRVELEAERAFMDALEAMSPGSTHGPQDGASLAQHLADLMRIWNGSQAASASLALVACLA